MAVGPASGGRGGVEHELRMGRTEVSVVGWMCGVELGERRRRGEERGGLLGLGPVGLMVGE